VNPIPSASYPTQAKRPHYSLLSKKKVKQTFKVDVPEWKESLNKMLNKLKANQ
jgi:dTDP-4-dehydrorhamnose reductase